MSQTIRIAMLAAAACGSAWILGGCQQGAPGAAPWMDRQDLPAEPWAGVGEAEYFNYLITQTQTVTQAEAYHAFLIWIDGKDEAPGFGQRIATLTDRRLMDPTWVHHPTEPITRGRLASMICRHFDLKSSVALRLAGPIERAARRELEYRQVMVRGGGDLAHINGAEFVNILKKADEILGPQESVAIRSAGGIE